MNKIYDAVIVGAGVAGCYLAYRLSLEGFSVLLLEQKQKQDIGEALLTGIMDYAAFEHLQLPLPSLKSNLGQLSQIHFHFPDARHSFQRPYSINLIQMASWNQELLDLAIQSGIAFKDNSQVSGIIWNNDKVEGAMVGDEPFKCQLVVDGTGCQGFLLNQLPGEWKNMIQPQADIFDVYYHRYPSHKELHAHQTLELWIQQMGWGFSTDHDDFYLVQGIRSNKEEKDAILSDFRKSIAGIESSPESLIKRKVMYGFPGASLVAPGFMVIGNAAAIANPFNGQELTYALSVLNETMPEIASFLDEDFPSIEQLWSVNKIFKQKFFKNHIIAATVHHLLRTMRPEDCNKLLESKIMTQEDFLNLYNISHSKTDLLKLFETFMGMARLLANDFHLLRILMHEMLLAGELIFHLVEYPIRWDDMKDWMDKYHELIKKSSVKKL